MNDEVLLLYNLKVDSLAPIEERRIRYHRMQAPIDFLSKWYYGEIYYLLSCQSAHCNTGESEPDTYWTSNSRLYIASANSASLLKICPMTSRKFWAPLGI